jgi:hypothetical protein
MMTPMDAMAAQALACLGSEPVRAIDPTTVDRLAEALTRRDAGTLVRATPHGGLVCFSPWDAARRVLELDRGGSLTAALRWGPDGELERARLRTAHGEWIGLETRTGAGARWGASDRLSRLGDGPGWQPLEPVGEFEAIRWSAISHVPPLADPARLPPGAGTAVLNLIAALARDQGTRRLRYRGPYPTEQLFTALLESFRFAPGGPAPLQAFMDGALDWSPAPHERVFEPEGLCVQLRDGIDKAVLGGRAYYRTRWQSVLRRETRRLDQRGDTVVGAVWALEQALEERFVLDAAGRLLARRATVPDPRPAVPLGPDVRTGVTAALSAMSAPALGPVIATAMRCLRLEWAGLAGDLVEVAAGRARLSWRLADAGAARVRAARDPAEALGRALEVLVEIAHLLADPLRLRAQATLAASPAGQQRAALVLGAHGAPLAAAIAAGAQALRDELARDPVSGADRP